MIELLQVVRAVRDVPEEGVAEGMVGTVIQVFDVPRRAYEVEFADAKGRTVAQATLAEEDLEVVNNGTFGGA
jgi:hypothetical protein